MKLKILVIGSSGQLGQEFKRLSKTQNTLDAEFIFTTRKILDITDAASLSAYFDVYRPDIYINCSAYTAVDKAETEVDIAHSVNAIAVANIAKECNKYNSVLVHYSTDYVFNGRGFMPYTEESLTDPINLYGQTKLDGEKLALLHNPKTIVVRTSWVYSEFGNNFVKTISKLAKERDTLSIVADQIGTPTSARNLACDTLLMIGKMIMDTDSSYYGLYNYSNLGVASWYDFARKIVELQNINCNILPIASTQYPTPARRPYYSVLDKSKIIKTFGLTLRHWETSLRDLLSESEVL